MRTDKDKKGRGREGTRTERDVRQNNTEQGDGTPKSSPKMPAWQDVAAAVQQHRDASLARVPGPPLPDLAAAGDRPLNVTAVPRQVLTARECELTELPPEALLAGYADGTLTVEAVVCAFLRRAALAQKLVNCITELLPERALDRARELDGHVRRTGQLVGPLHGIPLSVKEHVSLRGLTVNVGFVSWAAESRVQKEDATLVRFLCQAGCVPFARTTEPQTLVRVFSFFLLKFAVLFPCTHAYIPDFFADAYRDSLQPLRRHGQPVQHPPHPRRQLRR